MKKSGSPPENIPTAAEVRKKWLVRSMVVLVLTPAVIVASLVGGRGAWHAWQKRKVEALNDQAEGFYEKKNVESTMKVLREVMAANPLNERALRLWAKVLDEAPHNSEDAIAVWRKVCSTPGSTPADRAALGVALLRANSYKEAQAIWAALPQDERERRGGLTLGASLVRYGGNIREADQILRRAYEADKSNPEARLKLAALDLTSPFPEIKAGAAQSLWDIVRHGTGPIIVNAMQALATMQGLTETEAAELHDRLSKMHEVTGNPRYIILSGCMKALPQKRAQILDEEVANHQGKLGDESTDFLRWLAFNKESLRILNLVDKNVAVHSGQLFPVYAEALNLAGRWKELQDLLRAQPPPPISPAVSANMLALCSAKLGDSRADTLNHLKEALHHARSHNSLPEIYVTGASAEDMGFNDLALEVFDELAEHRGYKLNALDHVLQIRRQQGNLPEIIDTLETLLHDAPGLAPYLDLFCYHKILAGDEIEKTAAIARHAMDSGRQDSPTLHISLALAAYRARDFNTALSEASTIVPHDLPAGQRAVLAGILEACGKTGEAYQLAEKISPRLLLAEETRFLKDAL